MHDNFQLSQCNTVYKSLSSIELFSEAKNHMPVLKKSFYHCIYSENCVSVTRLSSRKDDIYAIVTSKHKLLSHTKKEENMSCATYMR